MEQIALAGFLALVANRLTEAIVKPIKIKYPQLDLWWLIYPTWVLGGVLAWLAGVNLFANVLPDVLPGRILTAVVIGGGSNLIADLFGNRASK
jgi:hypothetical protein